MTFGQFILNQRKEFGLSQKDLAARIKKEDGAPISAQYLNALERDRRNPPSDFLLKQLARELKIPLDYIQFLAGQFPEDLREGSYQPETVEKAFLAFRKALKGE